MAYSPVIITHLMALFSVETAGGDYSALWTCFIGLANKVVFATLVGYLPVNAFVVAALAFGE